MMVVRDTFQAKYGKGDELVALFKEFAKKMPRARKFRMMVDASGTFFTVVTETEVADFSDW